MNIFWIETHGNNDSGVARMLYDTAQKNWRTHSNEWQLGEATQSEWVMTYSCHTPQWVRFGYLSQFRRQAQRMLIPVFMAAIDIKADDMVQGHILTVPATSNPLLMPMLRGADVPPNLEKRATK